jgi:hypothetical protein
MNKRTLVPVLLLLAIVAVIYAVYKSTEASYTTIEAGRTITYGQPQHGLTLGLCLFAGLCILGIALLSRDDRYLVNQDGQTTTSTTTTAAGSKLATNYPR